MPYVLEADKPEEALEKLIKAAEAAKDDDGYNEIQLPDGRILKVLIADEIEHESMVEIFGTNFHTCLRKCFDSKAASICHNAVSLLSKEAWLHFIKECLGKELTPELCEHALYTPGGRQEPAILLQIGLEMFDKQDWEILNKYTYEVLKDCGEDTEEE